VVIVVLHTVSIDYRHIVYDCLGDRLCQLKLIHCLDVDPLEELFPKSLDLIASLTFQECLFTPIVDAAALEERLSRVVPKNSTITFLPDLKELKTINTCLGYWSRLFECQRLPLIKLYLHCSHIGLPSVSRFNWSDVPNQWPNLKFLGFHSAVGRSTLNTLRAIAPCLENFYHLEEISVPGQIMSSYEQEEFRVLVEGGLKNFFAQVRHPLPDGLLVKIDYYPSSFNCCYQEN